MNVTFPNESYPVNVPNFKWDEFKTEHIFDDVVFGWWGDTYVKINKEDYLNQKNDEHK